MNKKLGFYLSFILVFTVLGVIISWSSLDNNSDRAYYGLFKNYNRAFSVQIPEMLTFAGETIPVDNFYIYEAIDREFSINTYWHSNTLLMLKRANRFFPIIEPILAKHHVPNDFKYLAMIESGLTNAVSPSGAAGIWQFLDVTAKEYKLEVSADVDERYHLSKATEAACKYLKDSHKLFGSWLMAAAAYNAGKDRIRKAVADQKTNNYFEMQLVEETARYVPRLIAMKTIYEDPGNYGFFLRKKDLYQPIPTNSMLVDTTINDLPAFAIKHHLNYRILRELNPWLRSHKLNNQARKAYVLQIPKAGYLKRSKLLELIKENNIPFADTIGIAIPKPTR